MLDERAAWYVASILAGAPGPDHVSPGSIAFKTGTSYGYRDAWAIGFDGRHVIGVWVGRPDGAPVPGLIGVDAAAPILMDAFARLGGDDAAPRRAAGHRSRPPPPACRSRSAASARRTSRRSPRRSPPEIAYPPAGVRVDLGIRDGDPMPLALKVRERRAALHLVRRRRAGRHGAVRRRDVMGAERTGLRRPHGDRRQRRFRDGNGLRRITLPAKTP